MTTKDESLQNQIEKTGSADESIDAYAYKKVFDALKQEPKFYLSANFADRVVLKLESKKESSWDFLWFGLGIFLFGIAALVTIVLTDFTISFGALKFLTSYGSLFVFGVAFIVALQWLDKKMIRPRAASM